MGHLLPFWRYYGAKWKAAPHYPAPRFDTLVEPFAGAAGYALRHYRKRVILVERYEVVASIWAFLIRSPSRDILSIPTVDAVADLPDSTPQEARWLVGMCMNAAAVSPNRVMSSGMRKLRDEHGRSTEGWGDGQRARVARQVDLIRHWTVIHGDYTEAPDVEATWFVDPPYEDKGRHYVHNSAALDFTALGEWCRARRGQTIVCEAVGATWLPFRAFRNVRASPMSRRSGVVAEAIWTSGETQPTLEGV